ncbi:MAG: tRNA (guanosine(37)-N1)-methyltransferase TrmD [Candidatus Berkelbacteria bacterium]|nr:tRNA (guanosine(37)-N1)-methyltransferase TrmD [Candidatus Berkelbacteria bacterium]
MIIDVLTLFPDLIDQALAYSIPARAQKAGRIDIRAHQLRTWATDRHGTVDDTPYGGGPGMILRVDVAHAALGALDHGHKAHRIMLSPDGELFDQTMAADFAAKKRLILLCGRYEGFDARIEKYVDQKVSIGSFVLSGGELAALTIIDAVTRLIPGVLGNAESLKEETFEADLTEYPQFTRPEKYKGMTVPDVLLSGHHAEIQKWRDSQRRKLAS